jgi:hypothetical protein
MRIRSIPSEGTHVELYVRSLAPRAARSSQESLLERLRRASAVDSTEVVVTGEQICPETLAAGTEIGSLLLDRLERFESWAAGSDREIAGFTRKTGRSLLTGESVSGVCFPDRVLAEYRDGELAFVAPCRADGREWTVAERVDRLAGEESATGADDAASPS